MDKLFDDAYRAQMRIKQLKLQGDPDGCLEDLDRELTSSIEGLVYEKGRILKTIENLKRYESREESQGRA